MSCVMHNISASCYSIPTLLYTDCSLLNQLVKLVVTIVSKDFVFILIFLLEDKRIIANYLFKHFTFFSHNNSLKLFCFIGSFGGCATNCHSYFVVLVKFVSRQSELCQLSDDEYSHNLNKAFEFKLFFKVSKFELLLPRIALFYDCFALIL